MTASLEQATQATDTGGERVIAGEDLVHGAILYHGTKKQKAGGLPLRPSHFDVWL